MILKIDDSFSAVCYVRILLGWENAGQTYNIFQVMYMTDAISAQFLEVTALVPEIWTSFRLTDDV